MFRERGWRIWGGVFNHLNRNTLFLHMSFFKSGNLSDSFGFILLLARLCVNIFCKRVSFNPGQDAKKSILVLILYIILLKCIFMNTASDWLAYPLWTLTTFTTISKVLDDVTSGNDLSGD